MQEKLPIVVFSHLRWDFVYQRPQHLLSRLAADRRIIVIEEPEQTTDRSTGWKVSNPVPNVTVYRPQTPSEWPGFNHLQVPMLLELLPELMEEQGLQPGGYVAWLYTPMAMPLAKALSPAAVVYDCMDELSAFRFAPPELLKFEEELLTWADVVFTGGPSLYRAKLGLHGNLHLFSSSVDVAHFRQAMNGQEAEDQASLPHPRFGFYGVIDERIDLPLVEALAISHPEWQIILVGPVVKIEESELPRRANLYYPGQRKYEELPFYLAGWDVCLLPFARNESTRYISPTKTLEYMAAELPIVSTPITDVAEPYGNIVYLGNTTEEFISACERALNAPAEERAARTRMMREVLAQTSWDRTAAEIGRLIDESVSSKTSLKAHPSAGTDDAQAGNQRFADTGLAPAGGTSGNA